jgi:hypothetical protein
VRDVGAGRARRGGRAGDRAARATLRSLRAGAGRGRRRTVAATLDVAPTGAAITSRIRARPLSAPCRRRSRRARQRGMWSTGRGVMGGGSATGPRSPRGCAARRRDRRRRPARRARVSPRRTV